MYEAILALQEGAMLADLAAGNAGPSRSEQFRAEARQLREQAELISRMLDERVVTPFD